MTPDTLTGVVHRLRVAVDSAAQRADADLVRAVARHRDQAAFADVVRRHGPMVLGTCRRMLRDHADADDAFQATFLVFLRRAGSLRRPERLAGWLFQVAYRTARKLRAVRLARRGRETELFDLPGGEPPAEFVWRELRPIFDAELDRLPDKLRLPAVLCLLEGRSKRDAARTLGWPEGTVAGRLQQAREALRRRFTARGLTLSAGALAVALFEGAAAVAISPTLFSSTIQGVAVGSASTGAAALADGVVHAMFLTKVKAVTAAVLLMGVVGTGTGVVLTPGDGPGAVLAQEKGPVPRDTSPSTDLKVLRAQIQALQIQIEVDRGQATAGARRADRTTARLREVPEHTLVLLKAEARKDSPEVQKAALANEIAVAEAQLKSLVGPPAASRDALVKRVESLRRTEEQYRSLQLRGVIAKSDYDLVAADLTRAQAELTKWDAPPARDPVAKDLEGMRVLARQLAEIDRAKAKATVEQLRDRKAFVANMVNKGFMTKTQLDVATVELAEAEIALAKLPVPPAVDAKRAKLEENVRKLTEIVRRTEESSRLALIPEIEVRHVELDLLRARLELALLDAPTDQRAIDKRTELLTLLSLQQDKIVGLIEQGVRRQVMSEADLRRARAEAAAMKADYYDRTGQYGTAVFHREVAVKDVEALLEVAKAGQEKGLVAGAEVRAALLAVAEAKANAYRAALRRQLAEIVDLRTEDLRVLQKRGRVGRRLWPRYGRRNNGWPRPGRSWRRGGERGQSRLFSPLQGASPRSGFRPAVHGGFVGVA